MKKLLLTLILCGLTFIAKSQNASVKPSTFGIQTGILGYWFHNKAKLSKEIALRSEIGLIYGFFGGNIYDESIFSIFKTTGAIFIDVVPGTNWKGYYLDKQDGND